MIVDCVSDLHGCKPALQGGDLLIIAGDLTARDRLIEYQEFCHWLHNQEYDRKIVIAGNHDMRIEKEPFKFEMITGAEYLCDSGTEVEYEEEVEEEHKFKGLITIKVKRKLKIWGSPWTKTFEGMNPKCKAFTCETEEELAEKWKLIPDDIDILITHSPPHRILDFCENKHVGSRSLRRIMGRVKPKLWVCGHIHEGYGEFKNTSLSGIDYHIVNASIMNEHYEPVNKPVRVIL